MSDPFDADLDNRCYGGRVWEIVAACLCEELDGVYDPSVMSSTPWGLRERRISNVLAKLTPEAADMLVEKTVALIKELTR
jgi:hypothetical protein